MCRLSTGGYADLGNVMADIIHQVHVQLVRSGVEHLGEGLAHQEGHGGAVHPGKVGGTGHGLQVVLPFLAGNARTRQLPVIGVNLVTSHGFLHGCQRICCHLQSMQAYHLCLDRLSWETSGVTICLAGVRLALRHNLLVCQCEHQPDVDRSGIVVACHSIHEDMMHIRCQIKPEHEGTLQA